MIELEKDSLVFTFPEVHPQARLTVTFQRTLRIPDDGKAYPLPPGLGRFPLKHIDDYRENLPDQWQQHGGVMLPMYQSEALWLHFRSDYIARHDTPYRFAVKVAAGKINAVTGASWTDWLQRTPQDYMVSPRQPWLDGFSVEKGFIRQFVAMPLGSGYSVEEQLTGSGEFGGLQIMVYPMRSSAFERRFPERETKNYVMESRTMRNSVAAPCQSMALAPGGRMRQQIYKDPYAMDDWEMGHKSRCFVHLANSLVWRAVTGENPPTVPMTAREYAAHGLPWFTYYADGAEVLEGSKELKKLKSVYEKGLEKGDNPLPENESVFSDPVISLH